MNYSKKNKLLLIILLCICLPIYSINNKSKITFFLDPQKVLFAITNYIQEFQYFALHQSAKQHTANPELKISTNEDNFLNALAEGRIAELSNNTQHPNLVMAETAFCLLKKYWPWPRTYTFLIPNLDNNPQEAEFIKKINIDLMRTVEINLIVRKDYIAKYSDEESFKKILTYTKKCLDIMYECRADGLTGEINRLRRIVIRNGKKTIIFDNICLAIAEKIQADPVTKLLHIIKHSPTLKEATQAKHTLENYVAERTKEAERSNGTFFSFTANGIAVPSFLL